MIGDSIIGWSNAIKALMKSYFGYKNIKYIFDPSDIREKGSNLITSGGKAPGPEPLMKCLNNVTTLLNSKKDGSKLTTSEVADIACYIADAVLAGGIRRAALIALFSKDDNLMLNYKQGNWWEMNPQRGRVNISVVLVRSRATKEDFEKIFKITQNSGCGEPGISWTNNAEMGANPCFEIALKDMQFCNLTTINASTIKEEDDFYDRVEAATIIGTIQAAYTDFHYLRPEWQKNCEKDALLGVSMTGIASGCVTENMKVKGAELALKVNEDIAEILGINKAARITTVKPEGTSSLVLGTSSGIHPWFADYYIRRIRVNKSEAIYSYLSIYHPNLIEDDLMDSNTAVLTIPQKAPNNAITRTETAIELLERVRNTSRNWVRKGYRKGYNHHNVSCTISVKEHEWDEVCTWMWNNKEYYNGISLLPFDGGTYKQLPFEECTKEVYEELSKSLVNVDLTKVVEMSDTTNLNDQAACGGGNCEI